MRLSGPNRIDHVQRVDHQIFVDPKPRFVLIGGWYFKTEIVDVVKKLTPRQKETLRLQSKGLSYKEIATKMEIKISTVAERLQVLRRKFEVHTSEEMIIMAAVLGIITQEDFQNDAKSPFYLGQRSSDEVSREIMVSPKGKLML